MCYAVLVFRVREEERQSDGSSVVCPAGTVLAVVEVVVATAYYIACFVRILLQFGRCGRAVVSGS